jgi:hypothetical protein
MATKKMVQTGLGKREYDLLSDVAKREGLTIKEAARRALLEWSTSRVELKDDPLFRLKPVKFRQRISMARICDTKPLSKKEFERLLGLVSDWGVETSSDDVDHVLYGGKSLRRKT